MSPAPLSSTEFRERLSAPPEALATWNVFEAQVIDPPPRASFLLSDHLLSLQLSGICRLRRTIRDRSIDGWCGPGSVQVLPAETEASWEGRDHVGASRAIALFVPRAFFSRVVEQDWGADPRRVEIVTRFLARDPVIEGLLKQLAFEAGNGSPSGSLYAESACEFLVRHVVHAHSSLAAPLPPVSGGLPARRLRLVLEYIEEHLSQRLTLRRLSGLAGVTPRHFERAFRQATGVPPHAYVLQMRVAAARDLLISRPALPVHEIAIGTGFSSASHLALAFRRQTGQSPTAFRRGELG